MKRATFTGAIVAMLVPFGFVAALNFDSISSFQMVEQSLPNGKLLYFYAPS